MYLYISKTKFLARNTVALYTLNWKTWQIGCPFTSLALIQREQEWAWSLTAKQRFIESTVKKKVSSSEWESCSLFTAKSGLLLGLSMRPWLQSLRCFHTARPAKNLKWSWNTFWLTMFCHPITLHLNPQNNEEKHVRVAEKNLGAERTRTFRDYK